MPGHGRSQDSAADRLLKGFAHQAGEDTAEWARLALDYKTAIEDHRLRRWTHGDVDDLLLGYLPARVLLDPDECVEVIASIAEFFEYLGQRNMLTSDSDPAIDLAAHVERHTDEFVDLVTDPATGGHARRLAMAMMDDGVDMADERAVEAWIEDFNSGPIERRDAVLGPRPDSFDPDDLWDPYDPVGLDDEVPGIDLLPRPAVDPAAAREAAATAPILLKFVALAEHMGAGRKLTDRGNLKLADARQLIELLETGDVMDRAIGDSPFKTKSATELVWLDLIVWWARSAGAVKVRNKQMSATKAWRRRFEKDPLSVLVGVVRPVFEVGPVAMVTGYDSIDPVTLTIEATVTALLARLYEGHGDYEELVASLTESMPELVRVPPEHLRPMMRREESFLAWKVRFETEEVARVLEMAGLVAWSGWRTVDDGGFERRQDGLLSLTPFGAWFVQGPLAEQGLVWAPVVKPLAVTADDEPGEIVVALAPRTNEPAMMAEAWSELGATSDLLDRLWRVDSPHTAPVLETLGQALPDKTEAKAARKMLLKHRSWMASRN